MTIRTGDDDQNDDDDQNGDGDQNGDNQNNKPKKQEEQYINGFGNVIEVSRTEGGSFEQQSRNEDTGSTEFAFKSKSETGYKPAVVTYKYYKEGDEDGKPTGEGTIEAATVTEDGESYEKFLLKTEDLADLKPGTQIDVKVSYPEDNRGIDTDLAEGAKYTLTTDVTGGKAKVGDTVTITAEPSDGYNLGDVTYTYYKDGDEDGHPTGTGKATRNESGDYEFTVPADAAEGEDKKIVFSSSAARKAVPVEVVVAKVDGETVAYTVNATPYMDNGDTIKLDFPDDSNYYVTAINVVGITKEELQGTKEDKIRDFTRDGDKSLESLPLYYKVRKGDGPWEIASNEAFEQRFDRMELRLTLAEKPVQVTAGDSETTFKANGEYAVENGTIKLDQSRLLNGEAATLTATLTPEDKHYLKKDSVKAVITDKDSEGNPTETTVYGKLKKDGSYTFDIPSTLSENAKVNVQAEFAQGDTSVPSASIGVSVGVNVVQTTNNAIISGDTTITAGDGMSLNANTEKADSTVKATAGYSDGNIGVGGGIAVNVSSAKTNAKIYNGVNILLNGGDFEVGADADVHFGTKGLANGGATATKAGVGSGIAVAVTGSDVTAAVQDGVAFQVAGMDNLSVMAKQTVQDAVVAKAGGSGGNVSVMPVLALDITGSSANAYLGAKAGSAITLGSADELGDGDELKTAVIYAKNDAKHEVFSDGNAAGSVAIGAAFDLSIIDDSAEATLKHSVTANGVFVGADAISTVEATANAGASGAAPGGDDDEGKGDAQADKAITGAAGLADMNGSKNVSTAGVMEKNSNRQKAETSEGGVAVAAAFVLNLQDNAARAILDGNIAVQAVRAPGAESEDVGDGEEIYQQNMNGSVNVIARNRTVADAKANGSATNSSVGIGAAVAINVVNINNIARVGGQVSVTADENINILADIIHGEPADPIKGTDMSGVSDPEDTRTALQKELEEALKKALESLMDKMGLSQYSDVLSGGIAGMVGQIARNFVAEMKSKNTGIGDKIWDLQSFGSLTDVFKENIEAAQGVFNNIPELVKDNINEILEAAVGKETLDLIKSLKDGSLMGELFDTNGVEKSPMEIINTTLEAFQNAQGALDNTVDQVDNTIQALKDTLESVKDINISIDLSELEEKGKDTDTYKTIKSLIDSINNLKELADLDEVKDQIEELIDFSELLDTSGLTDISQLTDQLKKLEELKVDLQLLQKRLTNAVETVINTDFAGMAKDMGSEAIKNLQSDMAEIILDSVKESILNASFNADKLKEGVQEALIKTIKSAAEAATADAVAEVKGIYNDAKAMVDKVHSIYTETQDFAENKVDEINHKLELLEGKLNAVESLAEELNTRVEGIITNTEKIADDLTKLPDALNNDI